MKRLATVLLTGALAVAALPAFAQVNAGAVTGTSGGAVTDTDSATRLNASIGGKAKASSVKTAVGIDASGNAAIRLKDAAGGSSDAGAGGGVK